MANTRFQYVRKFEIDDALLPNCWLVVRVDGRGFTRFCDQHGYKKPNDDRGLSLMTRCAETVLEDFGEVVLAYGQSDEFSFVLCRETKVFSRRASKLVSVFASLFTSAFVFSWSSFFPETPLLYPPVFDARIVAYPTDRNLRDYLSWRQADCHINCLYNTCFWKLVESGVSPTDAEATLRGTVASDKNELLFSRFGINYNDLPPLHRRGTLLVRERRQDGDTRVRTSIQVCHEDVIGPHFWKERPWLTTECGAFEGGDVCMGNVGQPALHAAIANGSKQDTQFQLQSGGDVNERDSLGRTPVHVAASLGHGELVRLLIDRGANVQAATYNLVSPLHAAALHGHISMVELLLANGARLDALTKKGRTCLHAAAQEGHTEIVERLLDHENQLVNVADECGWTPLIFAAYNGHVDTCLVLLKAGADVTMVTEHGRTALMAAAHRSYLLCCAVLMQWGGNVLQKDKEGRCALDWASTRDRVLLTEWAESGSLTSVSSPLPLSPHTHAQPFTPPHVVEDHISRVLGEVCPVSVNSSSRAVIMGEDAVDPPPDV